MWWKCLLHQWSGRSFFPPPSNAYHVFSDASGSWGCGAFAEMVGWFQAPWPSEWHEVDISVKELVPVTIAAALWGLQWSNKHICFNSDNMAVEEVLQRRTAKSPPLMHLLRCVSPYSAVYGFHFTARHVPGVLNDVADALSRDKANLVISSLSQVPQFHLTGQVHKLLSSDRPDWGSQTWTELFSSSLVRGWPRQP